MDHDWTVEKQHHGVSPEYIKKMQRKRTLREWLISLLITLVILGVAVGAQYWFMGTTQMALDMKTVWLGNAIGGAVMLLIVHHFVKTPKEREY